MGNLEAWGYLLQFTVKWCHKCDKMLMTGEI